MKDLLSYRMSKARNEIIKSTNEISAQYDLPAFILEEIVADVLCGLRQASKVELLRELEMQNAESIQSDNVEK